MNNNYAMRYNYISLMEFPLFLCIGQNDKNIGHNLLKLLYETFTIYIDMLSAYRFFIFVQCQT